MSQKGRRANAWDDAHLTGALWPLKILLRVFSSITLSVILLTLVSIYGMLASVPIGLLALIPTKLVYALSFVCAVLAAGVLPAWMVGYGFRQNAKARFRVRAVAMILLTPLAAYLWWVFVWPPLHYDPVANTGLRLFPSFVDAYSAITLRRLPMMEMSELEFYAWWPLRVILLAFVVNMVVATVRRIEFTFKNLGVLTVHAGIVTISLGSIYYAGLKQEGDTLLVAGQFDAQTGAMNDGPPQNVFYDNMRVALYLDQGRGFEQRPLRNVPRYNEYNLAAVAGATAWDTVNRPGRPWVEESPRLLDLPVPGPTLGRVDQDLQFRVVGYAPFATPATDWLKVDVAQQRGMRPGQRDEPLRIVYMHSALPDKGGNVNDNPVFAFTLSPLLPAHRVSGNNVFSVEYTVGEGAGGMSAQRWRDLAEPVTMGTRHALVIEVARGGELEPLRVVKPVEAGQRVRVGDSGYVVDVKSLDAEPPFPIITEGFKGSTSSVAVVTISTPQGEIYDRWVYHRFPSINQDILEPNPDGRPTRRNADESIRISLIEADKLNVYIDEPGDGTTRAIVREPGGPVRVIENVAADGRFEAADKIDLRVGERWDAAVKIERPSPVPERERKNDGVGNHEQAMLGVEVSMPLAGGSEWKRVVWLPFVKYMGVAGEERMLDLPDGRRLKLAFGRVQRPFPDFEVQLLDFQMLSYDHRGAPRDYQSLVRVIPIRNTFEPYEHVSKLNEPLTAPFLWREDAGLVSNVIGTFTSRLNPRQFKLSQAGWDAGGWEKTQAEADAGLIPRPFVQFTILGVGNAPGIHVIALGSVLMGIGIPWAFYVKPWLVRREKQRIQAAVARGEFKKPAPRPAQEPAMVGAGVGAGAQASGESRGES